MRLRLLAYGKLKTPGLRESADYYKRLIRPWVEIEEIELKPSPVPDKAPAVRARVQTAEGEALLSRLGDSGAFYLLDETGRALTTLQWAELARRLERESPGAAFCIGGSLGFSANVRARARGVFCLGPQTLAHELARVVLLEQLYRAWSVTRGHPYHNP